jgi:hypothetical protein
MWSNEGVFFSKAFCELFSTKIEKILYIEAGLKPSFKVGLSVFRHKHDLPMYQPGTISKINTAISILPEFYGNITFCWKSKSGKVVHTYDAEFDESDLECWIEGLEPKRYWEELNKQPADHPLKIKNLPFEWMVYGLGTHMGLTIELSDTTNANKIIESLGNQIEKHNQTSEAKGRENGVVHNAYGKVQDNKILFRIDLGSAGIPFIRKLLHVLKKYPEVKKVVADL